MPVRSVAAEMAALIDEYVGGLSVLKAQLTFSQCVYWQMATGGEEIKARMVATYPKRVARFSASISLLFLTPSFDSNGDYACA